MVVFSCATTSSSLYLPCRPYFSNFLIEFNWPFHDYWGVDADWYGHKKSRHLNPIGISYGKNIGVGTLFAFFEARGIEGGERVTGYNPRYRYLGLGIAGGTNTLNSNEIELSITDGGLGYQFNFNKLFITPKVSGRHFNTNFAQYTFFSGNLVWIEFY